MLNRKGSKKEEEAKAKARALAKTRQGDAIKATEAEEYAAAEEAARRQALSDECRYITVQIGTCEQFVDLHTEKDILKKLQDDGINSKLKSVIGALFTRSHMGVMTKSIQDVLDKLNANTQATVAIAGHPLVFRGLFLI